MQQDFPREDGYEWVSSHIENARTPMVDNPKFSEDLRKFVRHNCARQLKNEVKKVTIGRSLAKACAIEDIPEEIVAALESVRRRAGIV